LGLTLGLQVTLGRWLLLGWAAEPHRDCTVAGGIINACCVGCQFFGALMSGDAHLAGHLERYGIVATYDDGAHTGTRRGGIDSPGDARAATDERYILSGDALAAAACQNNTIKRG